MMPVMELDGGQLDSMRVYAYMAYPDCEQKRKEFLATSLTRIVLESSMDGEGVVIPDGMLRTVLEAPPYSDVLNQAAKVAAKGETAGDILLYVASMVDENIKEPSIGKAVYMAEHYLNSAQGQKVASSDISIKKAWKSFRPVSHLWAAFRLLQFNNIDSSPSLPDLMAKDIKKLLAIAEYFRKFGESFFPTRTTDNSPLFTVDECWRPPENYVEATKVQCSGLLPWQKEILTQYSKRQYPD